MNYSCLYLWGTHYSSRHYSSVNSVLGSLVNNVRRDNFLLHRNHFRAHELTSRFYNSYHITNVLTAAHMKGEHKIGVCHQPSSRLSNCPASCPASTSSWYFACLRLPILRGAICSFSITQYLGAYTHIITAKNGWV